MFLASKSELKLLKLYFEKIEETKDFPEPIPPVIPILFINKIMILK